jgi:hypothetical protein
MRPHKKGIEYTTDKKTWIHRALALVPNLQGDPSKRMWTLLAGINGLLQTQRLSRLFVMSCS